MNLTYSSVMATLIQCALILLLVQVLLKFVTRKYYISPQFLYGVSLLFFIRLMLPVELGLSITIPSTRVLPKIRHVLNFHLFSIHNSDITLGILLIIICFIGMCYKLIVFFKTYLNLFRYIHSRNTKKEKQLTINNKYIECSFIQTYHVTSPSVYGIKRPVILLPSSIDFSDKELRYIILHELIHYQKRDTLFILIFELFSCFYWWNPLLIVFKKQLNKIMELRVDNELLKQLTPAQCIEYAECLLKVKKKQASLKRQFYTAPNFFNTGKGLFEIRVKKILNFESIKVTNKLVFIITLFLSLGSMFFIIEPFSVDTQTQNTTFEIKKENDDFLIEQSDGTFYLYIDGEFAGVINDINEFPESDKLPIYHSNEIIIH